MPPKSIHTHRLEKINDLITSCFRVNIRVNIESLKSQLAKNINKEKEETITNT